MSTVVPSPEPRPALVLPPPLGPGSTILSGAEAKVRVPIAGSRLVTVRCLATVGGSLDFYFVRPDGVTRYAVSNPTAGVVANNTQYAQTITCNGEATLEIAFTPTADTTVTFFDVYQL